jgi:16S rRNA (guanine527-N7)-methyltransferase
MPDEPGPGGTRIGIAGPESFAEAFKVPRETIHRLSRYAELLADWQKRQNLVSAGTLPHLWDRHFADSAQLVALAPEARLWLDLGSGAGFPGLVVAILKARDPAFRMHLVEATAKKCDFLAAVAKATEAPVEIHAMRIEELACRAHNLEPDVISARALAPLPQLLDLAAPSFRPRTRGLFLKGRDAMREVTAAEKRWTFARRMHPSLTAPQSSILEIGDLAPRQKAPKR